MRPQPGEFHSHVQLCRERAGLGPSELARRAGITRQGLHRIETGRVAPNAVVAFRLAQVLGCRVDELFSLGPPAVPVRLVGQAAPPGRVRLAQVGREWLAFPLTGQGGLSEVADGLAESGPGGAARVNLFGDAELARRTAVVAGCDPSLGLLSTHVTRHAPENRVWWHGASSLDALRALVRGEAHAAGIHLWEARSGVSNLPFVERELPGRVMHLFTLWSWEQGLMVQPGNPLALEGVADLLRPGVRLVNRGEGAGSRVLLDAWLDAQQVGVQARRALPGYQDEVHTPLAAAQRVASGAADVAPGPRSAALALGLPFIPLQRERFDLVVPDEFVEHPAITALLSVVQLPAFRSELQTLGGYDPAHAGERWKTTA